MAEEIELRTAATLSEQRHTIGIVKARDIDSWITGIKAREKKVAAKIDSAINLTVMSTVMLENELKSAGLPMNYQYAGIARRYARLKWLGYNEEAEELLKGVPEKYREVVKKIGDQLIDVYAQVRMAGRK
jgi:hypothetical protein